MWHQDITYYLIYDEIENKSPLLHRSIYKTSIKRGGAWTDTCLNRSVIDGKLQLPTAYIVCNSTPHGDAPALSTFSEIQTLFHEFGHGLQHMLTKIDFGSISGTNGIEWDGEYLVSSWKTGAIINPILDKLLLTTKPMNLFLKF